MQLKMHMVTIEDLVPKGHFLRKLESALDLSFVYEETAKLYSHRYGRPPYDPVVMVKYLLVGYLYGIPSERQIEQRIQTDMALRWYLGLDVFDRVPDHSTISQLRRRKPSFRKVFRRLFEKVVEQCIQKGLVSGRLVATDSTHVKANASRTSEHLVDAMEKPGVYWERLDQFEEEGLEELEKKVSPGKTGRKRRQKRTKPVRGNYRYDKKWVSRTDPESGHLNRPGKPQGPHYLAHQTVDCDHGIILDTVVTSGEVNDAVPYLNQIEKRGRPSWIRRRQGALPPRPGSGPRLPRRRGGPSPPPGGGRRWRRRCPARLPCGRHRGRRTPPGGGSPPPLPHAPPQKRHGPGLPNKLGALQRSFPGGSRSPAPPG